MPNTAAIATGAIIVSFILVSELAFEAGGIHLATVGIGCKIGDQVNRCLGTIVQHWHALLPEAIAHPPLHCAQGTLRYPVSRPAGIRTLCKLGLVQVGKILQADTLARHGVTG